MDEKIKEELATLELAGNLIVDLLERTVFPNVMGPEYKMLLAKMVFIENGYHNLLYKLKIKD